MSTITSFLKINAESVAAGLREAAMHLDNATAEMVLDFSAVSRIDPKALVALQELARLADEKAVTIVLRGVNVEVYKVLKLVNLVPRFNFVN